MITFKQMCESLTSNQRYSYFILESHLLPYLTYDELQLVYVEGLNNIDFVRIWYPPEKFKQDLTNLRKQLTEATIAGNYEEVIRIGKLL